MHIPGPSPPSEILLQWTRDGPQDLQLIESPKAAGGWWT